MIGSKKLSQGTLYVIFISFFAIFVSSQVFAEGVKNIIVMISDGCGYYHIDATDIYQYGKINAQVYTRFPVRVGMATYSAGNFNADGTWQYQGSYDPLKAWSWFEYVKTGYTDSASAASAMSTGLKTYDAAIGMDIDKKPLKHISEKAEELGKATGVITSVQFSHATPAGFVAHNVSRNDYSGIAREMILDSKADLIMGCGNPDFDDNAQPATKKEYKYVGGEAVWKGLLAGNKDFDLDGDGSIDNSVEDADGDGTPDTWVLIQDVSEFQALMNGATPKRVIGVPQVYQTLQYNRKAAEQPAEGAGYQGAPGDPFADPLNENIPTLEEMTKAAINILDNDPDGFLLMIEGGAIDWASHANSSGRMIEEEIDFNNSVEAVVDWVNTNSNWNETLLIVTGDHECGYLTGTGSGPDPDDPNDNIPPVWKPIVNNGAGKLPGMEWHSGNHTNSIIPFFAKGKGSDLLMKHADETDPVRGKYIDNTEIAKTCFELMAMPVEDYGNVFFMELNPGLNMVSLPLKPAVAYNAETFAKELGATVVICMDNDTQEFVGYVPGAPTSAFPIKGGKGYIVNVESAKTVPFVGAAWTNTPSPMMAPGAKNDSAWAFVVSGNIATEKMGEYSVQVRNLRTGEILRKSICNSGYFALASADLNRNSVVQVNDTMEISVIDASGNVVSETTYTINPDNIKKAHLDIPLKIGMLPSNTNLFQNYPNPFNPETWIPYQLCQRSDVKVCIYSSLGQLIREINLGNQNAGTYVDKGKAAYWDGCNQAGEKVGSGVYFYQLQAGDFSTVKKMIIQK